MSRNRNLKYQFDNVITNNKSFKEGMDKHSMKRNGLEKNSKVFSYSDRKNLIDLSSNFSNFMKEKHSEIKMLKDIKPSHVQEFLESKRDNCSQQTLNQYKSYFNKLEVLTNNTYKTNVNFSNVVTPVSIKNGGGKIRTDMLSNENYNRMINNTTNTNLKNSLMLSKNFSCRSNELSKLRYSDLKYDESSDLSKSGIFICDSKGGRSRFVSCDTQEQKNIIKNFLESGQQGRICPIQSSSLQQSFRREKKKLNISSQSDFHSTRKSYATESYQRYREQGMSIQESMNKVSFNLGHGDNGNRNDLMKEYICCQLV